ncbi:M48 family metallopeptidase [Litoribacillus peritrichatus]|uniref:M48 family metallopeptidase n=1 Tax=Litoribacillus peritrichatus TaxID=718191 RepID=A0ABP7MR19_9GAMM
MERIQGLHFDAKKAKKRATHLEVDSEGNARLELQPAGKTVLFQKLEISDRIGNSTRFLTFPNGDLFETDNNDQVDQLITEFGQAGPPGFLQQLPLLRIGLLILVLLLSWLLIRFAIPSASYKVAMMVPTEVLIEHGQQAFKQFDEDHFEPSELSEERQQELTDKFQSILPEDSDKFAYKLHFRASEHIGANAFALPSGDVVITDELVELAESDDEITSIMLHEIAHVELRHSFQSVVRTSTMILGVVVLTGDLTSLNALVFAIPALLLNTGYSRNMEAEADDYSLEQMKAMGIDPQNFATIMTKLAEDKPEASGSGYWSSHPPTENRIAKFEQASQEMKQQRNPEG